MTSAPTAVAPETATGQDRPLTWGDHAGYFAWEMALEHFQRGDLAELRRIDPDTDAPAVLWRLLASRDLLDNSNRAVERKWALILHGIALMTRTAGADLASRSAHSPGMPVGRALYLGNESARQTGFYSEMRFNRLLNAREDMLRVLLARMFRMAASAGVTFNWWEMANFIRNADYNEEAAEASRRRLARDYYQAKRRATVQSDNANS